MQPSALLSIILGGDLGHIFPKIVESYEDTYGYLALYNCQLSGRLIAMGNRTYPYSAKEAKEVLDGNFSATVDFPEEKDYDLPSVTFYHSATGEIEKNHKQTETTPTSFAAASLGTFKSSKVRRVALSARSGKTVHRAPREDQNSWKDQKGHQDNRKESENDTSGLKLITDLKNGRN